MIKELKIKIISNNTLILFIKTLLKLNFIKDIIYKKYKLIF